MSGFTAFFFFFNLLPYKVSLLAINGAPASGRLSSAPLSHTEFRNALPSFSEPNLRRRGSDSPVRKKKAFVFSFWVTVPKLLTSHLTAEKFLVATVLRRLPKR